MIFKDTVGIVEIYSVMSVLYIYIYIYIYIYLFIYLYITYLSIYPSIYIILYIHHICIIYYYTTPNHTQCKFCAQSTLPSLPLLPLPPQHKLLCTHSVYAPLLQEEDHHYHHHTVQVTILHPIITSTITTATTTTITTAQAAMHAFSICATALGKKTDHQCKYCVPGPALAPFSLYIY